jgi:hypothetical protein
MKRYAALFAVIAIISVPGWIFWPEIVHFSYVGPALMRIQNPEDQSEVPVGAVDVQIDFPDHDRVAVETFECRLNGQDVTDSLTVGRNGAVGEIVGLREGDNHILVRVFGRSFWNDRFVDEERSFTVRVRAASFMDLARS